MIGDEVFFLIKKYGQVKVTSESNAMATPWLTAAQTTQFKAVRGTKNK
jgi:hypothetical protein